MTLKTSSYEWFLQREELLKKYSDQFHGTIQRRFDEMILRATELKNKRLEAYALLSKQGKPFADRKSTGEKIEALTHFIEKIQERKKEIFPSLAGFLTWGDYEKIERGFERFIELYFC